MGKNNISIQIGESEISFDTEKKSNDCIAASVKQDGKFLFEFNGLVTDKFIVKKYADLTSPISQTVTEIYLERGLGKDKEVAPLVKITHFT